MTTNIATTVQQSKALLEYGIDPCTADMIWIQHLYPRLNFTDSSAILAMSANLPAWSFDALMQLLPTTIDKKTQPKWLRVTRWEDEEKGLSFYSAYYEDAEGVAYHEIEGKSAIECLIELILSKNILEK